MNVRKKLIEVALPLEAINAASALEKQPFTRRHPRSMHIWWARRPLAAARAVIFAQMVDDPSSHPDIFRTEKAQEKERQRLFRIIEELVKWENTSNAAVLERARAEIWQSWRSACADYVDHPRAKELFDRYKLPAFHDPFAGGGALPLEAQRLGLESFASDLNPVAVLINKAMIDIPPRFADKPPVHPESRSKRDLITREWRGTEGLADDVRCYGEWMRDEAESRLGHLYPGVRITEEIAKRRPDLKTYVGKELPVIACLWARTVKSPDPAFGHVDVPLAATFMLSTKANKDVYVEPVIEGDQYRFLVRVGVPKNVESAKNGTKLARANFRCLMSGAPITGDYIRAESQAGRMGVRMMAIVAEGKTGRVYLSPTPEMEEVVEKANPEWKPDVEFFQQGLGFRVGNYGMTKWSDLFTNRQLVALTTFTDLVREVRERVKRDAIAAGLQAIDKGIESGGNGAESYADAISVYLAMATSRWSDLSNSLCSWNNTNQNVRALFSRQAIPMSWDFVELFPFSKMGSWFSTVESSVDAFASLCTSPPSHALQSDAATQNVSAGKVVSTDPPYYDNVGYADLSDFFYVWLRRSLRSILPDLFATVTVPKAAELVATPDRHGGRQKAESFFLEGMTNAMRRLAENSHPAFPVTIYYAFKQTESDGEDGTASTGWETFLSAVIRAGFAVTGTWPMRTEREARSRGIGSNALASSIILVCYPRPAGAPSTTRRDFLAELKTELSGAIINLQRGNIAPVDLAQSAIGPGMGVYTRYEQVLDAQGNSLTVRDALTLINQVLDQIIAEQEGDFDADTRWALAWFEQFGFDTAEYGIAETLSKAKNTSVLGMVDAGILSSKGGKVRLLTPNELDTEWDPVTDQRLTAWEVVHQLIRSLEFGGETSAGGLAAKLGSKAEAARELAYRLYTICERKKRAPQALSYNALVQSWPEITRLGQESGKAPEQQADLFGQER